MSAMRLVTWPRMALMAVPLVLVAGCDEATLATIPGTDEYKAAEAVRVTRAEEVALWEAGVASVGCKLVVERDYLAVEFQAGITRERLTEILSRKINRGEVVTRDDGGFTYVSGPCTPAEVVAEPAAT